MEYDEMFTMWHGICDVAKKDTIRRIIDAISEFYSVDLSSF